jgi:hypothetical protein
MAKEDDFQVRLGRIRSSKSQRAKPFIAQAAPSPGRGHRISDAGASPASASTAC